MRGRLFLSSLFTFFNFFLLCGLLFGETAGIEGLSRTSWGRFGWWETHVNAVNRDNIDGLLSYQVTLDGLSGVILTKEGMLGDGGAPYTTIPLPGNSRIWNVRFGAGGDEISILPLSRVWSFAVDPEKQGTSQGWQKEGFDHSGWRTMIVGPPEDAAREASPLYEKEKGLGWGMPGGKEAGQSGCWENQGLPDYDGLAWYRLKAVIPKSWEGEEVYFHCYGVDDEDQTYVNGVKVGETTIAANGPGAFSAERLYKIPEVVIHWGKTNTFAVLVNDTHGLGGFCGSAVELIRGKKTLEYRSVAPMRAGAAPPYIKNFNWVTKWVEFPDYQMTYSLASALVRVKPKVNPFCLTFDLPINHAAYVTGKGVRIVSPKDGILYDPRRDGALAENWLLLWHGDAADPNGDLPVLMVLHARPEKITSTSTRIGIIHSSSNTNTSFEFGPPFGLRRFSGGETEQWTKGLPEDVLAASRFWSRAGLAYPVGNKELYNVDQDTESVTITEKYEYETIKDDWNTRPLKIAPVPPILACLLDAGYPAKMLSKRSDPGFITYYGPFAATLNSDTASFSLPIPVEDSFAALETPGREKEMDELTLAFINRAGELGCTNMSSDSGPIPGLPAGKDEPMDFDQARERAFTGAYPDIGIPKDHIPGKPLDTPRKSSPVNTCGIFCPPGILVADSRVQPGIVASFRRMARGIDASFSDTNFYSGIWRSEFEPTFKKQMTYQAFTRYENISSRLNGEAPYDFTAVSGIIAFGFKDAALSTGEWEMVRKRWGKLLQVCDSYWRNHDWASAACDNKDSRPNSSVDITWNHTDGIEALARCAYAIGDYKTYDFLCYLRARLALVTYGMEAIQQYLQPILLWPDNYFAGHVGEPYPPYRLGILPEGGVGAQWEIPYPEGAVNQVPWRFNSVGNSGTGGLRWMAMTQPTQARWFLNRFDRYLPNGYDGERNDIYGGKEGPFFNSCQRASCVNQAALAFFLGDPVEKVEGLLDRIGRTPAVAPWFLKTMTLNYGNGLIQQLLAAESCPMWASVWEPRILREGRYDPASGKAGLVFLAGAQPLRFKGFSRILPLNVLINGAVITRNADLKTTRAGGGWYYDPARQTIHVYHQETGKITLEILFPPDPNAPTLAARMEPEKPNDKAGANLLTNGSFNLQIVNGRQAPFVGAVPGPHLYVNRWLLPATSGSFGGGAFQSRHVQVVGSPTRSVGLALKLFADEKSSLIQNMAATPGNYRLTAWLQMAKKWDAVKMRLSVTLKAVSLSTGAISDLKVESKLVLPENLAQGRWTPIILEIAAPEKINAIQVAIAFLPVEGASGDANKEFPVYFDDLELVRVASR